MRCNLKKNILFNKLTIVGLLFSVLGLSGCISNESYLKEECEDGICTSNQEYNEVCVETPEGFSVCEDAPEYVNYTKTAADFRKYGERTPRDHRITQARAGNNMSAAIPPSIDDEVVDYEVAIMEREGNPNNQFNAAYIQATNEQGYTNSTSVDNNTENAQTENKSTSEEEDTTKDWLAEEGQSLKELLTNWSEESGWRLIWKTNRNYTLNAGAMFRGNFADVASALVRAFARARPAPVATLYKGNRVLVIETMEDENAYD